MSLTYEELEEMLEDLFETIRNEALRLNRAGDINLFKSKYNIQSAHSETPFEENAKILIIGVESGTMKNKDIAGIFKQYGLSGRYDVVSYKDATNYDISILENNTKYSDIFIGPVPHSMKGMGNKSSGLDKLINDTEGRYPYVIRLRNKAKELHLSKESLKTALSESKLLQYISWTFSSLFKFNQHVLFGGVSVV